MGAERPVGRRPETTEELLLESRDLILKLTDKLRSRDHVEDRWPGSASEELQHRLVESVEVTGGYRAECSCGWVSWPCATSLGVIDEWACHCVESDLSK